MNLDNRLSAVISLIRKGGILADIGSDHAYVPIYALENNIAISAVASDINSGPVARSTKNIIDRRLQKKINAIKADGLDGIERFHPSDIVISGMGGMLICDMLKRSEYIKSGKMRLILQPMKNVSEVRHFLSENGFAIVDEKLAEDEHKIYQIIAAEYSGIPYKLSAAEKLAGPVNITKKEELFDPFIQSLIKQIRKRINGLMRSGKDAGEYKIILAELEKLI